MLCNPAASLLRGVATVVTGSAVFALLILGADSAVAASAAARHLPHHPTPHQVERFWTPRRMAAARPLEMTVGRDGRADVHLGPRRLAATASYSLVETPETPPYSWNGRLYVVQGKKKASARRPRSNRRAAGSS